jgi:hypothetical protein
MIRPKEINQEATVKAKLYVVTAVIALVLCMSRPWTMAAQSDSHERNAFTPDNIPWGPAPPFLAPGAQFAVLEGNPSATTGDYTVRLKMPDGYQIAPHFHPLRENVTVISGTFKVGMGDVFNKNKMAAFTAGSFAFLDPSMHHYAMACGEVVVQVHGQSPLKFNFINPQDDASNK